MGRRSRTAGARSRDETRRERSASRRGALRAARWRPSGSAPRTPWVRNSLASRRHGGLSPAPGRRAVSRRAASSRPLARRSAISPEPRRRARRHLAVEHQLHTLLGGPPRSGCMKKLFWSISGSPWRPGTRARRRPSPAEHLDANAAQAQAGGKPVDQLRLVGRRMARNSAEYALGAEAPPAAVAAESAAPPATLAEVEPAVGRMPARPPRTRCDAPPRSRAGALGQLVPGELRRAGVARPPVAAARTVRRRAAGSAGRSAVQPRTAFGPPPAAYPHQQAHNCGSIGNWAAVCSLSEVDLGSQRRSRACRPAGREERRAPSRSRAKPLAGCLAPTGAGRTLRVAAIPALAGRW